MKNNGRKWWQHAISLDREEAEYRACNSHGHGCDRRDPGPFAQLQHAYRQTHGNTAENQQGKSSRQSHSGYGRGRRLSRITARHTHHADKEESEGSGRQDCRAEKRQNCNDGHTAGAFQVLTSSRAPIHDIGIVVVPSSARSRGRTVPYRTLRHIACARPIAVWRIRI